MVPQPQPQPLPRALLDAEFVFVSDDASIASLQRTLSSAPIVREFFFLQIGDKLKPVISSVPAVPAVPPL